MLNHGICSLNPPICIQHDFQDGKQSGEKREFPLHPRRLRLPPLILPTHNPLINPPNPIRDLPTIDQVILIRPPASLLLILTNPRLHMPRHKPLPSNLLLHVHEPDLIHQFPGLFPLRLVQSDVVALKEADLDARRDGDVVRHRVFDSVVEAGRVDRFRLGKDGRAHGAHERQIGRCVEGEGCAAPGVGSGRVWQRRELGARDVVTVERDEGCDEGGGAGWGFGFVEGIEARGEGRGEGRFAWC